MNFNDLSKLKDNQLLENFSLVVKKEREAISVVVSHLAEIDRRRLYAREGFSSLFCYCVEKFNFSEEAAYLRIHAARVIQKYQDLLEFLERGEINLTTIRLISVHLTEQNREWLLKIEIDHRIPFSLGGESTVENLQLLCRSHNQWRAFKSFPQEFYQNCR